jgi:hypothetical protein
MFAYGGAIPSTGYDNGSDANREFRARIALERDERLNTEERKVYDDALIELEFGKGFFLRAHP